MGSVASLVLYPCVGPSRKTLCVRPVRAARPVLSSLLFIVSRAARRPACPHPARGWTQIENSTSWPYIRLKRTFRFSEDRTTQRTALRSTQPARRRSVAGASVARQVLPIPDARSGAPPLMCARHFAGVYTARCVVRRFSRGTPPVRQTCARHTPRTQRLSPQCLRLVAAPALYGTTHTQSEHKTTYICVREAVVSRFNEAHCT